MHHLPSNSRKMDAQWTQKLSLKEKATLFVCGLKNLRIDCENPEKRKSLSIKDIIIITEHIAEYIGGNDSDPFQALLIEYLQIVVALMETKTAEGLDDFQLITEFMCDLWSNDSLSKNCLNVSLKIWLKFLQLIPSSHKYRTFRDIDRALSRNCGRLLFRMTRFSMQIKMLDIICSYLYGEHLQRPDPLVRAHIFISLFHGNTVFSVDVKKEITKILDTKAEISFKDKHHLLSLINSSNTNRSVFSMPITKLKPISLNNKTQPDNPGWIHLNKMLNEIEIWLPAKNQPEKIVIQSKHLQTILVKEMIGGQALEVKFMMSSPPKYKTSQKKARKPFGKSIDIIISDDFKEQMISLLNEMFPTMISQTTNVRKIRTPTPKLAKKCEDETFCPEVENCFNEIANDEDFLQRDKQLSSQLLQQDSTYYGKNGLAQKRSHSLENKVKVQPMKTVSYPRAPKNSCDSEVSSDVFEFSEDSEEVEPSKKRRRIKQPKKRSKPAPWPRIKTTPKSRREKVYTVGRRKEEVTTKETSIVSQQCVESADNRCEMLKIIGNLAKINEMAVSMSTAENTKRNSDVVFVKPPPRTRKSMRKTMKLYNPEENGWDENLVTSSTNLVVEKKSVDMNGNIEPCQCIRIHKIQHEIGEKLIEIANITDIATKWLKPSSIEQNQYITCCDSAMI